MGAILFAALRQAIVGALLAPLKTAGFLMGGDDGPSGMQLDPVSMEAGAIVPSGQDLKRLAKLAKMLEERPGLGLELRGATAPEDGPLLAEQILHEQIVADADLPPVDAGFLQKRRLRGALEERADGHPGELDAADREALGRWIASVEVPVSRFEALANARADAVRVALVDGHGVDSGRVRVADPTEGAPGVVVGLGPAAH